MIIEEVIYSPFNSFVNLINKLINFIILKFILMAALDESDNFTMLSFV